MKRQGFTLIELIVVIALVAVIASPALAQESAPWLTAKPESIELLDQEDVPLAYLPGNATRIRLKVVGDMNG